jgi:hypothetical protein
VTEALPAPLVPAYVDLRSFDDMPLDVRALRDSETAHLISDAAFRAAVLLWGASWHQIPAASLPDDDRQLAYLAGYGRDMRGWKRVKTEALRGFQKCSDGRLYHPFIAKKALKSWDVKRARQRGAELTNDKTGTKQRTGKKQKPPALSAAHSASPSDTLTADQNTRSAPRPATATEQKGFIPSYNPSPETAGLVGGADAPTARPSAPSEPEQVRVTLDTGAVIRIDRYGLCNLIAGPKDCPVPALTPAQALELRRAELARLAAEQAEDFPPIPAAFRRTTPDPEAA